jgi:hypothetical protein
MAITLLGYFGTMVATLLALMMLLNSVLSSGMTERAHHQPHPYVFAAQAAPSDNKQAAAADKQTEPSVPVASDQASAPSKTAGAPPRLAAKQAMTDRSQRQKLMLNQSRREEAAARQQDQQYSLALGYSQEAPRQSGPQFDLFGSRRF